MILNILNTSLNSSDLRGNFLDIIANNSYFSKFVSFFRIIFSSNNFWNVNFLNKNYLFSLFINFICDIHFLGSNLNNSSDLFNITIILYLNWFYLTTFISFFNFCHDFFDFSFSSSCCLYSCTWDVIGKNLWFTATLDRSYWSDYLFTVHNCHCFVFFVEDSCYLNIFLFTSMYNCVPWNLSFSLSWFSWLNGWRFAVFNFWNYFYDLRSKDFYLLENLFSCWYGYNLSSSFADSFSDLSLLFSDNLCRSGFFSYLLDLNNNRFSFRFNRNCYNLNLIILIFCFNFINCVQDSFFWCYFCYLNFFKFFYLWSMDNFCYHCSLLTCSLDCFFFS